MINSRQPLINNRQQPINNQQPIINKLTSLPVDVISEIAYCLDFKSLTSLEQSCKEIKIMISDRKIWENLGEQYGLFPDGKTIKAVLSNYTTASNFEELAEKVLIFFDSSENVFFKCLFREKPGMLEIERIQHTQQKNSLTILYAAPLDGKTKDRISQQMNDTLVVRQIFDQESFNITYPNFINQNI